MLVSNIASRDPYPMFSQLHNSSKFNDCRGVNKIQNPILYTVNYK